MEMLNSYYGVAENDFLYAKAGMTVCEQLGNYNNTASLCSQAAEKFFKAVIEKCFSLDNATLRLLHTHNLRALYNQITTKYTLSVDSKSCKWLGDFYFDVRYPGDSFVIVNKEDAEECIRLVEIIQKDVSNIIFDENKKREIQKKQLNELKAFPSE